MISRGALPIVALLATLSACSPDDFAVRFAGDGGLDAQAAADGAADALGGDDLATPTCGLPGQACCAPSAGVRCAAGGCCVTVNLMDVCLPNGIGAPGSSGTVCADGAITTCGANGEHCCSVDHCSNGCCVGNYCVQDGDSCGLGNGTCNAGNGCSNCGGQGDNCCSDARGSFCVASGLACDPSDNRCRSCGSASSLCCDGNLCDASGCCVHTNLSPRCVAPGGSCGTAGVNQCLSTGCSNGACGRATQACCPGGIQCTSPLTRCQNGTCVSCGTEGQPCCPSASPSGSCIGPLVCDNATCVHCGGPAEPCCLGDACAPGATLLVCVSGTCN